MAPYHAIIGAMYLVSIMLLFVPCIWSLSCYYLFHVFVLYHAIISAMHLVSIMLLFVLCIWFL
jgi:hypothetical protein